MYTFLQGRANRVMMTAAEEGDERGSASHAKLGEESQTSGRETGRVSVVYGDTVFPLHQFQST